MNDKPMIRPSDQHGRAVSALGVGLCDAFAVTATAAGEPVIASSYVWPDGASLLTFEIDGLEPENAGVEMNGIRVMTIVKGPEGFRGIDCNERAARTLILGATPDVVVNVGVWG